MARDRTRWVRLAPYGPWHRVVVVAGGSYRFVCRSYLEVDHPQAEQVEGRPKNGCCQTCAKEKT